MKLRLTIIINLAIVFPVLCQISDLTNFDHIIDQNTAAVIGNKQIAPANGDIYTSLKFATGFNNTMASMKSTKQLGYNESSLKGITTRQIPGAPSLYKKCAPGVVLIVTIDATSIGSGSIINAQGDIITNWHVVNGSEQVFVAIYDPKITSIKQICSDQYSIANVIAVDKTKDLALIRLVNADYVAPLEFGNEYELSIAQDVFAIGHPEQYIWSFTYGVISQLRNKQSWSYGEDESFTANVIQTQTPTNPGNSGGPLFNAKGKLVGINSYGAEGQGLNFAVRIGEVKKFVNEVKAGKHKYVEIKKEDVEETSKWEPLDRNENGIIDGYRTSINEDGYYDAIKVDDNEDGIAEFIAADSNHDGEIDIYVFDDDGNGTYELFVVDENFDGDFDFTGVDTDGDMIPDEFSEYNE